MAAQAKKSSKKSKPTKPRKSTKSAKLTSKSTAKAASKSPRKTTARKKAVTTPQVEVEIVRSSARPKRRPLAVLITLIIILAGALAFSQLHRNDHTAAIPVPHRVYAAHPLAQTKAGPTKLDAALAPALARLGECTSGMTDVVVAHEDDDLLFMNLDLANKISSNSCVRTVYITAGDDGRSAGYWKAREDGIERAYAYMASAPNDWTEDRASIYGQTVSSRHLVGHPSIGLIFLRLPDGNLKGQGFESTGNVSLEALESDDISHLTALDGSATYTYVQLKALVSLIVQTDQPTDIFTHLIDGPLADGDHSDHHQVGQLTLDVRNIVRPEARLTMYAGYPGGRQAANLSYDETYQKREIFLTYAAEDAAICHVMPSCPDESTYTNYFSRLYKTEE